MAMLPSENVYTSLIDDLYCDLFDSETITEHCANALKEALKFCGVSVINLPTKDVLRRVFIDTVLRDANTFENAQKQNQWQAERVGSLWPLHVDTKTYSILVNCVQEKTSVSWQRTTWKDLLGPYIPVFCRFPKLGVYFPESDNEYHSSNDRDTEVETHIRSHVIRHVHDPEMSVEPNTIVSRTLVSTNNYPNEVDTRTPNNTICNSDDTDFVTDTYTEPQNAADRAMESIITTFEIQKKDSELPLLAHEHIHPKLDTYDNSDYSVANNAALIQVSEATHIEEIITETPTLISAPQVLNQETPSNSSTGVVDSKDMCLFEWTIEIPYMSDDCDMIAIDNDIPLKNSNHIYNLNVNEDTSYITGMPSSEHVLPCHSDTSKMGYIIASHINDSIIVSDDSANSTFETNLLIDSIDNDHLIVNIDTDAAKHSAIHIANIACVSNDGSIITTNRNIAYYTSMENERKDDQYVENVQQRVLMHDTKSDTNLGSDIITSNYSNVEVFKFAGCGEIGSAKVSISYLLTGTTAEQQEFIWNLFAYPTLARTLKAPATYFERFVLNLFSETSM
jgi:hypothetical protein